jgi:uncharacterized membrane protein YoaK (UPF0700 family)
MAGYVDGYGLLVLGTSVSFMSGNTTTTGLKSGQAKFHAASHPAIAVLFFVTGSFLGTLFSQSRLRHSHRLMFGVIAGMLATVAGVHLHGLWNGGTEIAILSVAMGMMNPALSRVGGESVGLTFVTGTLSRIGGHLAGAVGRKPVPDAQGPRDSHLVRFRIDAIIWSGFVAGAGLSGMVSSHFRTWGLLPPCIVLIALSLFSEEAPSPEKRITSSISGSAQRSLVR